MDLLSTEPPCGCLFHDSKLQDLQDGPLDGHEVIKDKLILLLYVANWCEPCHTFSRLLENVLQKCENAVTSKISLLLVCVDDEKDMSEAYKTIPKGCLLIPSPSNLVKSLTNKYSIRTVPKLVVCKPNGEAICLKGRSEIESKGTHALTSWVDALNAKTGDKYG